MQNSRRVGGAGLIGGALAFWLAWFLMPTPGVADAAYILESVAATPERVWLSVAVQLLSSTLFAPALLAFVAAPTLAGIGVAGLGADAIYQLLAHEMAQAGIARDAMLPVMARFQSQDLMFVAPLLLAPLVGLGLMSLAALRAGLASRLNPVLHGVALVRGVREREL